MINHREIHNATPEALLAYLDQTVISIDNKKIKARLQALQKTIPAKTAENEKSIERLNLIAMITNIETKLNNIEAAFAEYKALIPKSNIPISLDKNTSFLLTNDIIYNLLSHLSAYDRLPLQQVSKQFYAIINTMPFSEPFIFNKHSGVTIQTHHSTTSKLKMLLAGTSPDTVDNLSTQAVKVATEQSYWPKNHLSVVEKVGSFGVGAVVAIFIGLFIFLNTSSSFNSTKETNHTISKAEQDALNGSMAAYLILEILFSIVTGGSVGILFAMGIKSAHLYHVTESAKQNVTDFFTLFSEYKPKPDLTDVAVELNSESDSEVAAGDEIRLLPRRPAGLAGVI